MKYLKQSLRVILTAIGFLFALLAAPANAFTAVAIECDGSLPYEDEPSIKGALSRAWADVSYEFTRVRSWVWFNEVWDR